MRRKKDLVAEIAGIDFQRLDDCMRRVAFAHCETIPRDNPFCDKAGRCIDRPWINVFWWRMSSLN